jgi:hypothetical protein
VWLRARQIFSHWQSRSAQLPGKGHTPLHRR